MICGLSSKSGCRGKWEKNQDVRSFRCYFGHLPNKREISNFGRAERMYLDANFQNQLVLAISADENNPITFSKPAPEASPVLTLGKHSKGQVRTIIKREAF